MSKLSNRPRHGKFPVPFVTAIVDGKPDFRVHDQDKRQRVADEKLCQLCGEELGDRFVFVGFDESVERGIFGEPPMHKECFAEAYEICPWLAGADWSNRWENAAKEIKLLPRPLQRQAQLGVFLTDHFITIPDPDSDALLFVAGDSLEIRWISI